MGQKGSKPKGAKSRSPTSSGTSPLNNATYWEAEEDPDWDNCVMVVATQKGRRCPPLSSACSDDSLARSLHKEVDYPTVNVSRRSPTENESARMPLAPDSRYPTPSSGTAQRKRQNTLLDTGWHACFKNNNYVFVRNGGEAHRNGDKEFGDKWKENNDSDVTFIISTSNPIREGQEEKLVVSLQDPKAKIRRIAPQPPSDPPPMITSSNCTKKTPQPKQTNSSGTRNKRSDKKKTSNWFKRLTTPGRNRLLKVEATAEETTPIYESASDSSPESLETFAVPPHTIGLLPPPSQAKEAISPVFPQMKESKKAVAPSPPLNETPVIDFCRDMNDSGPHTSTPKEGFDVERIYKSLPRSGQTPHRLLDVRHSVRRRLPYEDMSPETDGENPSQSILPVILSPPQSSNNPFISQSTDVQNSLALDINSLQRRASCHKRIVESPKFENRLHPRASNTDIPYADSEDEVSFDERPRPKICKVSTMQSSKPDEKSVTHTLFSLHNNRDEKPGSLPEMRPQPNSPVTSETKALSASEPTLKIKRTASCYLKEVWSPLEQEENTSLKLQSKHLSSAEVKPSGASLVTPETKTMSSSKPAMKIKRSISCYQREKVYSPMEEEENKSLELHAKRIFSPDDSTVTFSPYSTPKRSTKENPVSCWLKEIRLLTESECLNALQAKELNKEDWISNALAVGNAQESAERIWEAGSAVKKHIEEMLESLKMTKLSVTPFSLKVAQFCSSVVELLKMTANTKQISQVEARIKTTCAELLETVSKGESGQEWKSKMESELEVLQLSVQTMLQQLLLRHLQVIVDCVEKSTNMNSLKRSVFALILLGRLNPVFCELMAKLGAVRSLLIICVETKWKDMHPCALRALTVLSCVPASIRNFEESGGVDCVCDVLCDEKSAEGARSEAAGLVAQITAPWTDGSSYVLRSITQNADKLVKSIANLASKTESSEVFLLSSAALANLSFSEEVLKRMKENKVLEILVNACRNSPHAASLFIKDQVATVLANMAAKEEYRDSLSSGGSLVLLLCFLQLRPSVGHGAPQLAACERIQQKAAIALARLCSNPDTSNIVAEMQGIQRLVKLCKDRKERNDSDSVLVACLAALRKIAVVRQKEEFMKLGAQELIEPRLWDAFLAHSSKRESYV
ncbi:Protein inscuteable-like protein, partial [Stegodyphus mimosarum]